MSNYHFDWQTAAIAVKVKQQYMWVILLNLVHTGNLQF